MNNTKGGSEILHKYFETAPSIQNTLDIFKGEWSSKMPPELGNVQAGDIPLFDDGRIRWAISQLGSVNGKDILDLGPLEGGYAYLLEKNGAASILSIEANTRAYLKCLIVKEICDLKRSHFLCGNFVEYLRTNERKFDLCFASGVLYHMMNPVELIYLLSKTSDLVYIWTHYFDEKLISQNKNIAHKFPSHSDSEYEGFKHILHRHEYLAALDWKGFCGGITAYSHWLSRNEILDCLKYFGYEKISIDVEQPDHPNGPSFALACRKS